MTFGVSLPQKSRDMLGSALPPDVRRWLCPAIVAMRTGFGGTRIVDMLVGDQLPRIC
jgi:hypothetical protein